MFSLSHPYLRSIALYSSRYFGKVARHAIRRGPFPLLLPSAFPLLCSRGIESPLPLRFRRTRPRGLVRRAELRYWSSDTAFLIISIATRCLHFRHSNRRWPPLCLLLLLHHQQRASGAYLVFSRHTPLTTWSDCSCKYRAVVNFLPWLTCLFVFPGGFHFFLTACVVYESDADRLSLGCCFAASSAAVFAASMPSKLSSAGSRDKITLPP